MRKQQVFAGEMFALVWKHWIKGNFIPLGEAPRFWAGKEVVSKQWEVQRPEGELVKGRRRWLCDATCCSRYSGVLLVPTVLRGSPLSPSSAPPRLRQLFCHLLATNVLNLVPASQTLLPETQGRCSLKSIKAVFYTGWFHPLFCTPTHKTLRAGKVALRRAVRLGVKADWGWG